MRLVKAALDRLYQEADNERDGEKHSGLRKHILRSEAQPRIKGLIDLAKSEPGISVDIDQLDKDHWLLNVLNGVIDLRTGKLLLHDPERLITKMAPVTFDMNATCPTFENFLKEILNNDQQLIRFIQRTVGYLLTGEVSEQAIVFFWGTGANGKSTLLNVLRDILGDYAKQAAPNLLTVRLGESHPTELADLEGARLVTASEIGSGKRLDEALVKHLTGGDRIKGRRMRQDFYEFRPTLKLVVATNNKPIIQGTGNAIWRRVKLIHFNVTISADRQDRKLSEKLRDEYPGILAWAVRGTLDWQKHRLGEPEAVRTATGIYQSEMDQVGSFLKEMCTRSNDMEISHKDMYREYSAWCTDNREVPMTKRVFSTDMKQRDFKDKRRTYGYVWVGITLRDRISKPVEK